MENLEATQDELRAYLKEHADPIVDLFEIVRLVDPMTKAVYRFCDRSTQMGTGTCYHFWKNGVACENCISARAVQTMSSQTKFEYDGENLYLVMVTPMTFDGKTYALELLRNVTGEQLLDMMNLPPEAVQTMLQKKNRALIEDPLTGVFNRRFLSERLPGEAYRALQEHRRFGLVLVDVDNFKAFNDTHGHTTGDLALRHVAQVIKSQIRDQMDWCARYGGEEFLVYIDDVSREIFDRIAERLISAFASNPLVVGEAKYPLTISAGAKWFAEVPAVYEEKVLIDPVDRALYEAKATGKNKVVFT